LDPFTFMGGCSKNPKIFFLTDAAICLAHEIKSSPLKLESSDKNSTKIKHIPWNYTGGGKTLRGNKTIEIIFIR
jgi:hypothetical protein